MPGLTLVKNACHDCGCGVLTPPYMPHPDYEYVTGFPLLGWDDMQAGEYFIGWICEDCMNKRYEGGAFLCGPEWECHV